MENHHIPLSGSLVRWDSLEPMTRLLDMIVFSMDPVGTAVGYDKVVGTRAMMTAATIICIQLIISFFSS